MQTDFFQYTRTRMSGRLIAIAKVYIHRKIFYLFANAHKTILSRLNFNFQSFAPPPPTTTAAALNDEIIWPQTKLKADTVFKKNHKSNRNMSNYTKENSNVFVSVTATILKRRYIWNVNPEWRSVDVLHNLILSLVRWIVNYNH